eukprot:8899_1
MMFNTNRYCDNDCYETPRSKIPIPLQSSATQPTSICHTPKNLQFVPTPLSTKSEPTNVIEENKNKNKVISFNNSDVQFTLHLVKLILTNAKQMNANIPSKTSKYLNDTKQHKIVIKSMLMAPIISHLVKSCTNVKHIYQKKQNYIQLLTFFIDYFEQIYPQLIWPKAEQLIQNINLDKKSKKKCIQIPPKNISSIQKQHKSVNKPSNNQHNIETPKHFMNTDNNVNKEQVKNQKFEEFINKVNDIGNKFEILQKAANNNTTEICSKIKNIQHKQIEFDKKLNNKSNNKEKCYQNKIMNEWEKSHHHLGKKQQENIDLLQHQTEKFENIAQRIKNALKQTEDPKMFENRLNFITKQSKHLEQKLSQLQQSMIDKAKHLENSVKNAFEKYKEIENISDLISIGVSPHNIIGINNHNINENIIDQEERKLSFLYKMSESETGFNYDQKKIEIKNIIEEVLDCRHKIDYDEFNIKSLKSQINEMKLANKKENDDIIDIEDEDQFKKRIKNKIEKTMENIQNNNMSEIPPSLKVHWTDDKNEMKFIKEDDLNKLMTLKPGIARKYRKNNKQKNNFNTRFENENDLISFFDYDDINKPSIDNILQKAKKNVQMKTSEMKTLIEVSNEILQQPLPPQPNKTDNIIPNVKIIRRITRKPPELQFMNSKPIPPKRIIHKKKKKIKPKKKKKKKK